MRVERGRGVGGARGGAAVEAQGLGKVYRTWRGPLARGLALLGLPGGRPIAERWALAGVDLAVPRGSALGIVGRNGAGKSTLLRVLAGASAPTVGRFRTRGRVTSVLALGQGFHQDFTGRENARLAGTLLGFPRRKVRARLDAIAAFAELEEAFDAPVRTYSTGMGMRLAFATALAFDPEVLLLDEVFAVGDLAFQERCVERLTALRRDNRTILFASHGLYDVRTLCDRAIWLEEGCVAARGEATAVVNAYAASAERSRSAPADERSGAGDRPRLVGVEIVSPEDGRPLERVRPSEALEVRVRWENPDPARFRPHLGVGLVRRDRALLAAATTREDGVELAGARGEVALELPHLPVLSGTFSVGAWLFDERGLVRYAERFAARDLVVVSDSSEEGLVRLAHRWRVGRGEPSAAETRPGRAA